MARDNIVRISQKVILSDSFQKLEWGLQSLYVKLVALADEEGFVENPKTVTKLHGMIDDDLALLEEFIIPINGKVVIKHHFLCHKPIQPTGKNPEREWLHVGKDKVYSFEANNELSIAERPKFVPPTVEEVRTYCESRKNSIDPEAFVASYASRGWYITKGVKMSDWKQAVVTWEKNQRRYEKPKGSTYNPFADALGVEIK